MVSCRDMSTLTGGPGNGRANSGGKRGCLLNIAVKMATCRSQSGMLACLAIDVTCSMNRSRDPCNASIDSRRHAIIVVEVLNLVYLQLQIPTYPGELNYLVQHS